MQAKKPAELISERFSQLLEDGVTKDEARTWFKEIMDYLATFKGVIEKRVASIKDGNNGLDGLKGDKGDKGDRGEQGPIGKTFIAMRGEKGDTGEQGPPGKQGSPDTAGEIATKLESLKGDQRLDASAIKNLPKIPKQLGADFGKNAHNALWTLMDVDVAGITVGQSIKWDGIRWIPFTPAGGASTAIYNEVVAGDVDTFTLANTPDTGTLRVYALGQRLVPTTDYTLAGAIITTGSTWSTGQITSDYEYT